MFACVLGGGRGAEVQHFGVGAEEKEHVMIMRCKTINHAPFILIASLFHGLWCFASDAHCVLLSF
jgi:hypothetical protein